MDALAISAKTIALYRPGSMTRLWHFLQNVLGVILRHPVTGTSIIAVLPDQKIVLMRRRDTGMWGLPGGIVDWGEDVTTAVRRELQEETGLQVTKTGRLVGVYSAPDRDPRMHSICLVIEVEAQGVMQTQDPSEVMDVASFERSELPLKNMSHDHEQQLQDYLDGKTTLA